MAGTEDTKAQGAAATDAAGDADIEAVRKFHRGYDVMTEQLGKVIVGQKDVIRQIVTAIFSRGHCLLVGAPGLAKTLLVSTISRVLSLRFKRIQFTPDLMPSDIIGTDIIQEDPQTGLRGFKFLRGPIFTNMLLADEINRTPPKTQSALLEAMQEHRVTVGEKTYQLEEPFFVLATQNPIEQEGTYPLPEAQLDRFMFMVTITYPTPDEELEVLKRTTTTYEAQLDAILTGADILGLQEIVRKVPVADHVYKYALELVRLTRPGEKDAPKFIKDWIGWGAGPRACQYLILGAKAGAILEGRFHATTADVEKLAQPVLRHRLVLNFNAESEGVTTTDVVQRLVSTVPKPSPE